MYSGTCDSHSQLAPRVHACGGPLQQMQLVLLGLVVQRAGPEPDLATQSDNPNHINTKSNHKEQEQMSTPLWHLEEAHYCPHSPMLLSLGQGSSVLQA